MPWIVAFAPKDSSLATDIALTQTKNALLDNLHKIRKIPAFIVQGRYDLVCPIFSADELHRAWPEAEYIVVPDAGHSVREPGITLELVAAVKRMQQRLSKAS